MLSHELKIGKAAEHLVCYDLIMQGHNAMLADQGMAFDVLVIEDDGRLCRLQVKGSSKPIKTGRNGNPHYRYSLKHAKRNSRILSAADIDAIAFVAMDIRLIAYIPIAKLTSVDHGGVVQAVDIYPPGATGKLRSSGNTHSLWGRKFDDYATFTHHQPR